MIFFTRPKPCSGGTLWPKELLAESTIITKWVGLSDVLVPGMAVLLAAVEGW